MINVTEIVWNYVLDYDSITNVSGGSAESYYIYDNVKPGTQEQMNVEIRYSDGICSDDPGFGKTLIVEDLEADFSINDINVPHCEQWLGLTVIDAPQVAPDAKIGYVEFIAKYKVQDKLQCMHEISKFQKEDGCWFYVDGKQVKVGRNDACPCGSGKKHKKCCGT